DLHKAEFSSEVDHANVYNDNPMLRITFVGQKLLPNRAESVNGLASQKAMDVICVIVVPNDFPFRVDSIGDGVGGSRKVESDECALAQQKGMASSGARVASHDVLFRIDSEGLGTEGAREIDGGEPSIAPQEAMVAENDIQVVPHDFPLGIDSNRLGTPGNLEGGERAFTQHKASPVTVAAEVPHDVPFVINSMRAALSIKIGGGNRVIDSGERAFTQQKAMGVGAGVCVTPYNLTFGI